MSLGFDFSFLGRAVRSLTIAGAFNVKIRITSLVTEGSKHIAVVFSNLVYLVPCNRVTFSFSI